ncbi:EAL domain-containing protein [Pelosinus sp. IPA-1]|uniref:putative bifunctional diguanylate cyclase/phosphodiesterase n=1 Tax=Pelosinus sp. IPA-1 TaxID=3029569 RepID=UPI0024361C48|nr:EAL domain-containing protein [Pelosinus sp. IPA-1]GMA98974.1 hypothetical protein PIPA1_17740 [Pelosinus sp. IPA-1]
MPKAISNSNLEVITLQERIKKLSIEKEHLHLINNLMRQLSAVQGLDNTVETMLRIILENVGGFNPSIYYFMDKNIYYVGISGMKLKLNKIEDACILQVIETRRFTEFKSYQTNKLDAKHHTWVFPLLLGQEVIGVFKMDGMPAEVNEIQSYLATFFHYASLLLKNEMQGYGKLKNAYEELSRINEALIREVKERKATEEALQQKTKEIRRLAYADGLTGLPNRTHLNERLNKEMESVRQNLSTGAVLFIDLDDLKMVNDTFGHTSGDGLIIAAGAYILSEVGQIGFVARLGGDEFMVILPGESDRKRVAKIADGIVNVLRQEYDVQGVRYRMSASIGIVIYPEDGETAEEVFKNADNALYSAKGAGKGCWRFYQDSMQKAAYEKIVLTNSLRGAIERGELFVHYQPQMELSKKNLVGFEALLRWDSPIYGKVSPDRFIPLAEQGGLIQEIGQWVLREACHFAKRLANRGRDNIRVAVNISSKQLAVDNFVTIVQEAVQEAGIHPCQLELEITESVLLVSIEEATQKLEELREIGICLSLDDFGTGYSSLTYLRNLPVETLKIDKSFIDMISTDTVQSEIIGAIINMAHSLKMTVVAEGVETEEQLLYLANNCCDCIQGYIYSRPVPEAEAIALLDQ